MDKGIGDVGRIEFGGIAVPRDRMVPWPLKREG